MFYSGFADEASASLEGQIEATLALNWRHIEARQIDGRMIHDLAEAEFDAVAGQLEAAGIRVNCLGSAVANWSFSPFSDEDFQACVAALERSFVCMRRFNCTLLRGMSFVDQPDRPPFDPEVERQVFRKVGELVRRCADAGIVYGHENCRNYGGQSPEHTLRLLEAVDSPSLKLIFDTGNPVYYRDRGKPEPCPGQNSLAFYRQVREHIVHVHIKDARRIYAIDGSVFGSMPTMPGDGDGDVEAIVADLLQTGYDGGFSIEPHLAVKGGRNDVETDAIKRGAYVAYGRRFMALLERVRPT